MLERSTSRSRLRAVAVGSLLVGALPLLLTGCGIGSERKDPLEIEIEQVEREKAELTQELEQAEAENAKLIEQIDALSPLGPDRSLDLYKLSNVHITKYTNFYDKNDDGRREKLIVYFQPIDTAGDVVKAAGTAEVQLWNLNKPSDQALLGQWQADPNELHAEWFRAMISSSYRMVIDAPESLEVLAEPLTVKLTFTDYLTGDIFQDQQTIDPSN